MYIILCGAFVFRTYYSVAGPEPPSTIVSPVTMKPMLVLLVPLLFRLLSLTTSHAAASNHGDSTPTSGGGTSIIFSTVERMGYAFDIFSLPIPTNQPVSNRHEIKITDGQSVNFNGHFPSPSSSSFLHSLLPNHTLFQAVDRPDSPPLQLVYVTERNGVSNIFYDEVYYDNDSSLRGTRRRSAIEVQDRVQVPLLDLEGRQKQISMRDRPSLAGGYLVYVSTHEDFGVLRTSSAAVYSTELKSGVTRRLTPYGIADFSPSVSPSGEWTAVASYGARGWDGEVEELSTDLFIFSTRDGARRVKVVEHGGWPCWGDERTLYFHRKGEDQWLSIYRAILPSHGPVSVESVAIQRVTPPGLHVFTPATSPGNKSFIAVATRRPTSDFRHIELFNLEKNEFTELTRLVSPQAHHYNPFISSDWTRVGYHRCREGSKSHKLMLQNLPSPDPDISLFRFDGDFPAVSPEGDRIAYANILSVGVVDLDGRNQRQVYDGFAFSTAWDPVRKGVLYTSGGLGFAPVGTEVDIIAINVDDDDDQTRVKKLTTNGDNNAFPSPSPDGKWIVFRSGRSGYKNLYIIDAVEGEESGLHRLTNGAWTDTMPTWSPDGEWIAFSSDRDDPDSGGFELYVIHPNGTGLRKVFESGSGGRTNHQWFSPDGKRILFTSDYAGISAEPISYPHHFQPYGEIFTVKVDGSDLRRFTHNPYEDGTPSWVAKHIKPVDVEWSDDMSVCGFQDCHWLGDMPIHGEGAKTMVRLPNMAQCAGLF